MKELVNEYEPEVLWSDGDWEASWEYWNATDFIAWYICDLIKSAQCAQFTNNNN